MVTLATSTASPILTRSRTKVEFAEKATRRTIFQTTLLSLPPELIPKIAFYFSVPTALSFALVSPALAAAADPIIWRSINVALPDAYGWSPDCRPMSPMTSADRDSDRAAMRAAEQLYRTALGEKMRRILLPSNVLRMGLVREVTMTPRQGVISDMILLLHHVGSGLQKLQVKGIADTDDGGGPRCWYIPEAETFDYRMISANINFPSPSHVRLVDDPLRSSTFIQLLLSSAPNLTHLFATLGGVRWDYESIEDGPWSEIPSIRSSTRLRYLRLDIGGDDDDDEDAPRLIVSLVHNSQDLEQVSINYIDQTDDAGIMKALMALPKLRDLCWIADYKRFNSHYEALRSPDLAAFPSLQRLVLLKDNDDEQFPLIPHIPTLQTFYFASRYDWDEKPAAASAEYPIITTPPPAFAERVRCLPKLSEMRHIANHIWDPIDFDELDEGKLEQPLVGRFSTLRHHHFDILYIYLSIYVYEIADELYGPGLDGSSYDRCELYTGVDGAERIKRFAFHYIAGSWELCWWGHHLSDYGGLAVPLKILERMREVQGASEVEWKGRGVKVGDAAWEVLTDWKESL